MVEKNGNVFVFEAVMVAHGARAETSPFAAAEVHTLNPFIRFFLFLFSFFTFLLVVSHTSSSNLVYIFKLADQDLRDFARGPPRGPLPPLPRDPSHDSPSHEPPSHDLAPHDHADITGPQHIHFANQDVPPEHTVHANPPSSASSNPPKRPPRRHSSASKIHSDSSSHATPDAHNIIANAGFIPSSPKPVLRRATSDTAGDYFESIVSSPLSHSVDAWSEYEVVLDDGTRQRRAVSLSSTVPDQDNEEEEEERCACERGPRDEDTGERLDTG